jgi:hypothetical protein
MARRSVVLGRAVADRMANERDALTCGNREREGQEESGANHNYTHRSTQQAPRQCVVSKTRPAR